MKKTSVRTASTATVVLALGATAMAAPAVGLKGDKTLVRFDTENPSATKMVEVQGVERLLGIDLRASDGNVYGITSDGRLVKLDLDTGAATEVATLSTKLPEGVKPSVDFNPVADRLRIMGSDGTNLRANPADGAVTTDGRLAFEAGDPNARREPNVAATAYTNSFGKPQSTAMYDLDGQGNLLRQVAPNDGTLKTIGSLGVTLGEGVAFDIQTTAAGDNTAWLATGGLLYRINVETGAAEKVAEGVDAGIVDMTILP